MHFPNQHIASHPFSDSAITDQLDRIFVHPDFSKSQILKKFLTYIVQETLTGNADHLKEYTIAINVLEKPITFNPQKDSIVRIHAGRLRHALSHYYHETGNMDNILIDIPKGAYVPEFIDRQMRDDVKKVAELQPPSKVPSLYDERVTFAILPFSCITESRLVKTFNDGLCLQISSALSQLVNDSVIAYQAIKGTINQDLDLNELAAIYGFNHVITGGTQYANNTIRVNVQIINSRTYKQLWSKIFESKMSNANLFEVLDDICLQTVLQAQKLIV